jgi:hypothetical protein
MAKWANSLVLDGGSDYIRGLAATPDRIKMHVIKAYSAGDNYSTTVTTNSCGSVSLANTDLVQSGAAGAARVTTVGAKAITLGASSGAGPNLHIAIVDLTGTTVLLVTDETTDQVLTSGGTFNVPSWTYTVGQPT